MEDGDGGVSVRSKTDGKLRENRRIDMVSQPTTEACLDGDDVKAVKPASSLACLICGQDLITEDERRLSLEDQIKKEVIFDHSSGLGRDDDDNMEENVINYDSNVMESKDKPVYSLLVQDSDTTTTTGRPSTEKGFARTKWTEDDKAVYQWFLTALKVNLSQSKSKSKRVHNFGWDASSGNDCLPFCVSCKDQLQSLVDIQLKIRELGRQLKDGIQNLKIKASLSEGEFVNKGIYAMDFRYGRARKQFVPECSTRVGFEKSKVIVKNRKPSRTNAKPAVVCDASTKRRNPKRCPGTRPVVLLSAQDKTNAEEYIPDRNIKPEISRVIPQVDVQNEQQHDDDNPVSDSMQLTSPGRRRSTRTKRSRHNFVVEELLEDPEFEPPNDDDFINDFMMDDEGNDWRETKIPPKKSHGSARNVKPRKKQLTAEDRDKDWMLDENPDNDAEMGGSNDDESDGETGKRKYGRYKLDREKRTATYKSLVFHQVEPFTEEKYQCSKCLTTLERITYNLIRKHYLAVHTNKFGCSACPFRTSNTGSLKSHIRRAHKDRPKIRPKKPRSFTICRTCGKPISAANRKQHEWTHFNDEEKQQALATGSKVVPWERRAESRRIQCDACGKRFLTQFLLKQHQATHHVTPEEKDAKRDLCQECGGRYTDLPKHYQRYHTKGKIFQCLEPDPESESGNCGKIFKVQAYLTSHKNSVHRKIREFKCPLCPREFTIERNLKHHMDLHKGIRPHQCDQCPVAFTRIHHLRRHVAVFHSTGAEQKVPRRKAYMRGPTMLGMDRKKQELIAEGKYLPPSALATWAAGREPTSHFPIRNNAPTTSDDDGGARGLPLPLLNNKEEVN